VLALLAACGSGPPVREADHGPTEHRPPAVSEPSEEEANVHSAQAPCPLDSPDQDTCRRLSPEEVESISETVATFLRAPDVRPHYSPEDLRGAADALGAGDLHDGPSIGTYFVHHGGDDGSITLRSTQSIQPGGRWGYIIQLTHTGHGWAVHHFSRWTAHAARPED